MAKVEIAAGVCGFVSTVEVTSDGDSATVSVVSECELVRRLADAVREVDVIGAVAGNAVYTSARQAHMHAACPVPCGIVKAVEVAANLALPRDVAIRFVT
jgi:hypothetical protein